jgi:hypothetical protein
MARNDLHSGMRRVPWGFTMTTNGLVATTSQAARYRRAEVGEFAIRLLEALGVSLEQLEALEEAQPSDPVAALEALRSGNTVGSSEIRDVEATEGTCLD